jgi:hypothetical protein
VWWILDGLPLQKIVSINTGTPITEYKAVRREFGSPNPPVLHPGEMHVIYDNERVYAVDFLCPCGCGSTCFTPVCTVTEKNDPGSSERMKDRCWVFDPDTLTITPSIRYLGGCKWHFNITNGRVVVHVDSGK